MDKVRSSASAGGTPTHGTSIHYRVHEGQAVSDD